MKNFKCLNFSFSIFQLFPVVVLALIFVGCAGLRGEDPAHKQEIQARMDLCKSFLQKQQPRQGLKELLAVEDRAATIPEFHFLMGLVQMQLKDVPEAVEAFRRAVDLDPAYGQAWNNLGQALILQKRYAEAEEALKRALEVPTYLTPEFPAYNLARMYRQQDREHKAGEYARLALDKKPGFSPAVLLLADIRLAEGRVDGAVAQLREGVSSNPNDLSLMLPLAENYLRLGETHHAKTWFQRILDLDPDSPQAQVARDYLDILP